MCVGKAPDGQYHLYDGLCYLLTLASSIILVRGHRTYARNETEWTDANTNMNLTDHHATSWCSQSVVIAKVSRSTLNF